MKFDIPKWQQEFKDFIGIKSGMILEGNILDFYPVIDEGNLTFLNLDNVIDIYGKELGAEVLFYNPAAGFYCFSESEEAEKMQMENCLGHDFEKNERGDSNGNVYYMPSVKRNESDDMGRRQVTMSEIVSKNMFLKSNSSDANGSIPSFKIFVLDFSSRIEKLVVDEAEKTELFMNLNEAIISVGSSASPNRKNTIVFIVDKCGDIPEWVYLNNPYLRTFTIETPSRNVRDMYVRGIREIPMYASFFDKDSDLSDLVISTEGFKCKEIEQIINLAINENISVNNIKKAVDIYKYGIADNPWEDLESDMVKRLDDELSRRVLGQNDAKDKIRSVLKRAINGLSGLQHSDSRKTPRGVLFLAGPTGVGKTETVKAIAQAIFGDEDACVRFDMSEYRMENSDIKLFGAPVGYVDSEQGGQLTNAVKNHPFSILLFDEIEKAHSSVLDKFLQVLEDGRMTDGRGNTVYFGETVIAFTSNIGMTEPDVDGNGRKPTIVIENVEEEDNPEFKNKVEETVKRGIVDYFTDIGRPELLNRIGDNNIIVFQFIDKKVAEDICDHQLHNIAKFIKENKGITLDYSEAISELHRAAVAVREQGGRGIGHMIEDRFINPLSDYFYTMGKDALQIVCTVDDCGNIYFKSK